MKKVNVNMGCGSNVVKGWVNIDVVTPPNADASFKEGSVLDIPLKDKSVDYMLLDQVLEHLAFSEVIPALYEIRRVLKVGGKCSIIVPDFEGAVRQWLDARLNEGAFDPARYKWFTEVIYGNQLHPGEFHQNAMSPAYLHYCLNLAGLTEHTISFWPEFGEIPIRPGMREYSPKSTLRNAQLVVDLTKTK